MAHKKGQGSSRNGRDSNPSYLGLKVADDESLTIGQFLQRLKTGDWFRDYYLLPLSGAIWSTPTEKILDFPAYAMLQFFKNHALLSRSGQHQ